MCSRTRNLRACVQWDIVPATKRSFQIWIPCSRHLRGLDYLMSGWRWRGTYSLRLASLHYRRGGSLIQPICFYSSRPVLLSGFIDPIWCSIPRQRTEIRCIRSCSIRRLVVSAQPPYGVKCFHGGYSIFPRGFVPPGVPLLFSSPFRRKCRCLYHRVRAGQRPIPARVTIMSLI